LKNAENARSKDHVVTVDAARGALAIGVMFYHLLSFEHVASLSRVGLCGVYGFFVISGFAMTVAYRDRLATPEEVRDYFLHRWFRIWPLYALAVLLTLALGRNALPAGWLAKAALNLSLAFGFANPGDTALVAGGWSIGIEIVFYILFPALAAVTQWKWSAAALAATVLVVLQGIFVNATLSTAPSFDTAWTAYTQPIAFAGYFAGGFAIGCLYLIAPQLKGSLAALGIAVVGILVFAFSPDDPMAILTGPRGALLSVATLATVAAIAFLPEPKGALRSVARVLGNLSYATYLLHVLVYGVVQKLGIEGAPARIFATVIATLAIAALIHRYVERPGQSVGRRLTAQATSR
jgi:peptidoglycan/LPS O-acetylase OafA/YrhL